MTYSTNYQLLAQQLQALISDETDMIANMANMSALLAEALPAINWVGFYRLVDSELVLGPFQGKVACIRIPIGKGVCGTAVSEGKTMRIDDVHQFAGHIACDAASNSEIVIPIRANNSIIAVLDIDSPEFSRFSEQDQQGLETLVHLFEQRFS
jgi:GAF domain-containing protein